MYTQSDLDEDDENAEPLKDPFNQENEGKNAKFRGMGFPNMNYMNPEAVGAPVQPPTLYKNFQQF